MGGKDTRQNFVKFLVYAHASCDETILHINFIKDTHKINDKEFISHLNEYEKLGKKNNQFIKYVEKEWK